MGEYVHIQSEVTNGEIVILEDKRDLRNVRKEFPAATVWFIAELDEIQKLHLSEHINRKLHKFIDIIKRETGGWVIPWYSPDHPDNDEPPEEETDHYKQTQLF